MNHLTPLLAFKQLSRSKGRAIFLLLAIIAASCLVVWTVGGYQSLFTEASKVERPLGRYDLKTVSTIKRRSGGMNGAGNFGGPFALGASKKTDAPASPQAESPSEKRTRKGGPGNDGSDCTGPGNGVPGRGGRGRGGEPSKRPQYDPFKTARVRDGSLVLDRLPEDIPNHIREKLKKADIDQNGVLSLAEERNLYETGNSRSDEPSSEPASGLTQNIAESLRADERVLCVDTIRQVRGFLFSPNARSMSMAQSGIEAAQKAETQETDSSYEEIVPDGIDPHLHRLGMAAYRAVMGTPAGLGTEFSGIDAEEPPFELDEGRWFTPEEKSAPAAVLGLSASKKYGVHPGDFIWLLTQNSEYQLKVIGILDADPDEGLFVPMEFADLFAPEKTHSYDALGIVLSDAKAIPEFSAKWQERIKSADPSLRLQTNDEAAKERQTDSANSFRWQSAAGSLLAVLASVMIIFTALSIGVEERRREIALLRSIGLSRGQIARSILLESAALALPGWFGGLLAGWLILAAVGGKMLGLNGSVAGISLLSACFGSMAAAIFPILSAWRIEPLEVVSSALEGDRPLAAKDKTCVKRIILSALGFMFIAADLYLVYGLETDKAQRAALHSGIGMLALVFGVLCLLPMLVRGTERFLLPVFAAVLRFDRTISAAELSNHIQRSVVVTAAFSIGGGLFVLIQIWGYSMLEPFLPNQQMPDAFAAFLPIGLDDTPLNELKNFPQIVPDRFEAVALEQAALALDHSPKSGGEEKNGKKTQNAFANVVFFGMNVDRSFAGDDPLVKLHFIEGNPDAALAGMKSGRGVVVNDALCVDFGLHAGGMLKVTDPKRPNRILEYEILGVTTFNGWQWLSKTSGVRRNFGRSGGIVFASDGLIRDDFQLKEPSYFWFDTVPGTEYTKLETKLDRLARKNFNASPEGKTGVNLAYVKLSMRESLYRSIADRADAVIWGLSLMPMVTLILTSIALAAVTVNSVRIRRRWFGMMRAVGVERSKLFKMILTESLLIGLAAAMASLLFGIPAAAGALKLGRSIFGTADPGLILPVRGLLTGLGTLIALSLLAAAVPAWKIGRAAPLDLLREED